MKYRVLLFVTLCVVTLQCNCFAISVRDVVYKPKNIGTVVFSHGDHINKSGMSKNCRACHDAIYNLKMKKRFTMADMAQGKSCGACHNGNKAFGLNACTACHPVKEIVYQVKETGPTRFSHNAHLAVAECGTCHPKPYSPTQKNRRVSMAAMAKGKSCGMCHNARQAFSVNECAKCHPVQELQFEEKSTGDILFSHAFHSGIHTCSDCHASLYKTSRSKTKISMAEMEQGKSCGRCHDGKSAFSVTEKCEVCHKM